MNREIANESFVNQYLSELEKILARNTRSQADEFAQGLRLVDAIREELGIEENLEAEKKLENKVKDWAYYRRAYHVYMATCYLDAVRKFWEMSPEERAKTTVTTDELTDEIFAATANAEQVVGYYLVYHGDDAYEDWLVNTKGKDLNEQDNEVERILETLCSKELER